MPLPASTIPQAVAATCPFEDPSTLNRLGARSMSAGGLASARHAGGRGATPYLAVVAGPSAAISRPGSVPVPRFRSGRTGADRASCGPWRRCPLGREVTDSVDLRLDAPAGSGVVPARRSLEPMRRCRLLANGPPSGHLRSAHSPTAPR